MISLETLPKTEDPNALIDYKGILEILPHRYPFLLVDKVLSFEQGETKTMTSVKNVSFNEPFFQGHFPEEPVMPGVLQVEALAQTFCILMYLSEPEFCEGKRPAFMGVDKCRFKAPVRPGDVMRMEVELTRFRRGIGTAEARCYVGDKLVSEATLSATMI